MRAARPDDCEQLLKLWASLFDDGSDGTGWRPNAQAWFWRMVHEPATATFPVMEVEGRIAACAIGCLDVGVPNPQCPTGRAVRLMHVVTRPEYRRRGFGAAVTEAVVGWARDLGADRVDLSATHDGERLYERMGFIRTSAPRMKLQL